MPQMILAVLALMMAVLFAHQQQRQVVRMQANMLRNELAVHASSVAEDRLSQIGAEKFDENIPTGEDEKLSSSDSLTSPDRFGAGYDVQANDLDDFHATDTLMYRTVRYVDASGNTTEDSLGFRVRAKVSYVQKGDLDASVNYKTKAKRVEITAYSEDVDRPDTTRTSWAFTCGSKCAW